MVRASARCLFHSSTTAVSKNTCLLWSKGRYLKRQSNSLFFRQKRIEPTHSETIVDEKKTVLGGGGAPTRAEAYIYKGNPNILPHAKNLPNFPCDSPQKRGKTRNGGGVLTLKPSTPWKQKAIRMYVHIYTHFHIGSKTFIKVQKTKKKMYL